MSIPPRLSSKLNEALGSDAAGDLVTWLDETRADFAELRQEMRAMEQRLMTQMGTLAQKSDVTALATDLRRELHVVDNKIERRFSDLILWSFVFWVGAVGAIALLAGVLKR